MPRDLSKVLASLELTWLIKNCFARPFVARWRHDDGGAENRNTLIH